MSRPPSPRRPSRRRFLALTGVVAASCAFGCGDRPRLGRQADDAAGRGVGRLGFSPRRPSRRAESGRRELSGLPGSPPAELYAPASSSGPLTLVLCLHGAGSPAGRALDRLLPWADAERLLLLAPKSVDTSWDVTQGGFGADLANIDRLLEETASQYLVDRYAVSGFSDGASYALSLGIANGTVFDSVIAWSPGFVVGAARSDGPRFFVSHGTADEVLPVDATSRRLVPDLRGSGYEVTYVEFDGGHVAPPDIRARSVRWLARG